MKLSSKARAIMVQGTMSNAGKSLLVAGLCRLFSQDGYRVAPFKSQNMALNSFVGDDGLELGRAQAMQAEAAGIAPDVRMNPILLKPTTSTGSQVIVYGRAIGNMSAREYFDYKTGLRQTVQEAFGSLAEENDIIVIEGAGSPAEINLKSDDIVNMGMARMANAPVLLAGDIDPGGVFAQLYGTLELLEPDEREMVKGLLVNKFRGDASILDPGISQLEKLCGKPVIGVIPYMSIDVDDEDSLSPRLTDDVPRSTIDVAVVRLPHIANFTDFNVFSSRADTSVRYVSDPIKLGRPDLLIVPGTKNTLDDLRWMHDTGMASCVKALAHSGTPTIGICGGYQMIGSQVSDPQGIEGGGVAEGLGLLPMQTEFEPQKELSRVYGTLTIQEGLFSPLNGMKVQGYEIHMGTTLGTCPAAVSLSGREAGDSSELRQADGGVAGNVLGTYLHGIFDSDGVADALIDILYKLRGLSYVSNSNKISTSEAHKQKQYDILASTLRDVLDMEALYRIVEQGL